MQKIRFYLVFIVLLCATVGTISAQTQAPNQKTRPPVHYGGKIAGFVVGFIIVLGIWRLTKTVRKAK
jgi:hypothetical protein